ncbi:MAG: GAF domain-containing sensor histidine kinase [Planctomycetota bacterium]
MSDIDASTSARVKADSSADMKLRLLYNLGAMSLTCENQEELLRITVRAIAKEINSDHFYIMLRDLSGQMTTAAAQCRTGSAEEPITASGALMDKVMETSESVLVTDAMNNPLFSGDPAFQRFNIKTAICVPIRNRQKLSGLLYADTGDMDCDWNSAELELLEFTGLYLQMAVGADNAGCLNSQTQRLIAAGRAVQQISHSVKNVLQLISGAAEVMDFGLRTNQIHRVKRSWQILMPNLDRIKKFTLDMLDFSKERRLEYGACNFNSIIQGAIESLQAQLKQKKVQLHIRIDQRIENVELDGERIHEMALNLILNAIDIVDEQHGIVNIETKFHPEAETIELSVSDNGPGMTDEIKKKIFEPYESTKNKFGTGLGMAIAKHIIDQHKGTIDIKSEVGKGTTFVVTLPTSMPQNS